MATPPTFTKILNHIDRDEIINKMIVGAPPKEINEWLRSKYSSTAEHKFVLSEKMLKSFQDNHLDFHQAMMKDFSKAKTALVNGLDPETLELVVSKSPKYQELVLQAAGQEVDYKRAIATLVIAVETRLSQIYDLIQQNAGEINQKGVDRLFFEAIDKFSMILERAHKMTTNAPDQVIQHNISVQHMDQHASVFYEAIKRCLAKMDLAQSMAFMEIFNEEMSKLKDPSNLPIRPVEGRLAEVKVLNEAINQRINS